MRALERARQYCTSAQLLPGLLVVIAVLCLPALWVGYQLDDWHQQVILRDPARDPLWELFTFAEPARNEALRAAGRLPWWAPPELQVQLWRPLSALTHQLDHAIAPGSAVVAHLHSLGWMLALVAAATALFRRIHGPSAVAGLAAVLYAVDEAHGLPVGWISNRNALITGVLGIVAVLAHDRAVTRGRGQWQAPAVLLLALLAGEAAVAAAGWIAAHALFIERGPPGRRLTRLLPVAAVVVLWRLVYVRAGGGTRGSGLYLDPLSEPLGFLAAMPGRVMILLGDQIFSLPSMGTSFLSDGPRRAITVACALALAAAARLAWPLLRSQRIAGFWLAGMLLSCVPIAATFPASRLLTFVGLGGAGLLAMLVEQTAWRARPLPRWLGGLLLLHLVLAPLALPAHTFSPRLIAALLVSPCADVLGDAVEGATVIYVNANELCASCAVPSLQTRGRPAPRRVAVLGTGHYPMTLTGIDARTLEMSVPAGMQSLEADRLFRADEPLPLGHQVVLPAARYEVTGHNPDGRVSRVRITLPVPLTDPSLRWYAAESGLLAPLEPPAPARR